MKRIISILTLMMLILAFSVSAVEIEGLKDPGALPGDFTYGMKTAWERVQLTFTWNKQKQIEKRLEFAERRLAESAALREQGKIEASEQLMERYQAQIEKVDDLAGKSQLKEEIQSRIQEKLYNHSRVMDRYRLTNSTVQTERIAYLHNHINQNAQGKGK